MLACSFPFLSCTPLGYINPLTCDIIHALTLRARSGKEKSAGIAMGGSRMRGWGDEGWVGKGFETPKASREWGING